jgi:peptide/nickel transport system permease protein
VENKKKSQWGDVWRRFKRNKLAVAGLVVFCTLCIMAITAPLLLDYATDVVGIDIRNRLQSPSRYHWFGTDDLGRDVFARVVWGSRFSLSIGLSAAAIALFVGGFFGAVAGFYGGWLDNVIMRIMDIFQAIPGTLLAIAIAAALGPSVPNLIIALAASFAPSFARVVRGPILSIRGVEYIEAAKAIGAKNRTIIVQHVLPNCMAPVIIQTTLTVAIMILITAGLSFLGLGIEAPAPEWGSMLSASRGHIRDNSYLALFPGLAIMATILSLNLLGDGLRDALDPRLK